VASLFSPIDIRDFHFRNRIVMPPMVREHGDVDGCVTDVVLEHYRRRAAAGTGTIIVEATATEPAGRTWDGGLCAYFEGHLPGLSRLAATIQAEGAVAMIQLVHGGPKAAPRVSGMETVAPSAVPPSGSRSVPRALTVDEIHTIVENFAAAAQLAIRAGFDGVEIHGAHGYLLDSFLSKKYNVRQDEYGGSMRDRARVLAETCRRVRARIGEDPLLGCRISIFDKLHEGFSLVDLRTLIAGLEETGLDLLHLSTLNALGGYFDTAKTLGQWAKEMTALPIIVAGRLREPADAERVIAEGHADFAAVGKAMMTDPEWTRGARKALMD